MKKTCSRKCAVLLVTLAMVLSIIPAIPIVAVASEDINNPGLRTVQLLPHETEYSVDMRPHIAGTFKTIYSDAQFTQEITAPFPVPPGEIKYIYAKYVQDTILPDPHTLYYQLKIIGRATSETLYLDTIAGVKVEIDPGMDGGEGTIDDPFIVRIDVPNSQETIKHIIDDETDILLRGGTQGVAFTHADDSFSDDDKLANRTVNLVVGENKIYVAVWSENGARTYYYIITVVRQLYDYTVTFNANGGTGSMPNQTGFFGAADNLNENTFERQGYRFTGWATSATGVAVYADKQSVDSIHVGPDGVVELFAVWTPIGSGGPTPQIIEDEPTPLPFIEDHVAYIIGYPEGDVRPGNNVTRAEVATVFFRLLKNEIRMENWTQTNTFTDVSASNWHNNAVSVMSKMGIVNGYSDGTFKPNGAITRAELAAIAARFARIMGMEGENDSSFTDISGHWAEDDIIFAALIGWVNGYSDGTYRPNQPITRAEFMTLVNRMLERVPQTAEDLLTDGMVTWSDNADTTAWFYLAVQEATNSHLSEAKEELVPGLAFQYEYWVEMDDNPDWAMLEKQWAESGSISPETPESPDSSETPESPESPDSSEE